MPGEPRQKNHATHARQSRQWSGNLRDGDRRERDAAERKREADLGLDFRRPGSPAQAAGGGGGPGDAGGQQHDQQGDGNEDDEESDGEDREPRPAEEG